ncbi:MAG TPA: hypothetical protein VFX70_17140 [Mycobacteriales bacterium]|nr:hypothetical protein [Mycobacteriales bacterium]
MAEPDSRFLRLVEDHGDTLLRAARLLCGDWAMAEDLLQRALARTLIRWDPRRSGIDLVGLADLAGQELIATYLDEFPELDRPGDEWTNPPGGPLLYGLGELDPAARATVVGGYYLDLADRDLAGLLGVAPGQVRHLGARSLAWLHQWRSAAVGAG